MLHWATDESFHKIQIRLDQTLQKRRSLLTPLRFDDNLFSSVMTVVESYSVADEIHFLHPNELFQGIF